VERKVLAQHFMQQRLPDLAAAECLRLIAASREVYQAFVDLNQLLADRSFDPAIGDALVTAVEKVSPEAPEAPRLRVLRPLIYAAARRPQEAVQTWLAVRDQEEAQPLTKHFLPTLFGTCQRTGTTQAAQDTLAAAATLAEAPDILIHWYAEWLERVGNKAAAIAQYERLRERAPAGAQTRRRLAQLYAETDREAEALAMYEQLLAEQPTDLGLHEAAARAHERFGRWEQARALYEKGLALAQSAEAKQRLQDEIARLQAADGSPEERLAALQAAREKDPRNGKRYELLGDFYLEQDNIPAAAEAYDRAMELYFAAGQSRDLFYDRKMALRAAGRWETAVAFYQAAIDRGRVKRIDPFMLAGNETLRAQADVTLEKFAAAQQRLIAAQPAGDQAAEAWLAIAEAYGSPGLDGAKHGSLALAACDSARESAQRPELKIQAQERAAQVAQQVLHDPLEEEARYRALIEAFPERYEAIRAQFALARLYERQGDLKAAESIYEEVLARPDKQYAAAARVALGQVLLPQGEREEALALLRSVVKESRDPTVMREAQRLIAGVEGLVVTFCYRTTETFAVHTRDVRSGDPATAAVETVVAYECAAMDKRRVTATLTLQTARELNPAAPEFQQARFSEAEGRTSIVWTDELWTKPLTLQGTSFWSRCLVSAPQTDARVPGAFTLGRRFELRENGRGTATLRLTLEGNQGLTALVHESEEVHLDTDTFSPRPDQIQPGERRCFLFFLRASHRRPQEIQFDVLLPEGRNVYYPRVTVLLDRQYYELPSVRDPVQRYESAAGDDKAILELAEPFFIEKAWGETFRQVVVQEIVE
jgi:tetratricopeptide (TPR) repeat protein